MRYAILVPATLLGLAGCAAVQVPAGSQITASSISPAPAGSLTPVVRTNYVAPPPTVTTVVSPQTGTTTTYVTPPPMTTRYVIPAIVGATSPSEQ
jgi:hypothetical protein